jgi:hypothetical protein
VLVVVLHAGFAPLHWVSEQQLPGIHAFPFAPGQQTSPEFEQAAPTVVHALRTHFWLAVSQMLTAP